MPELLRAPMRAVVSPVLDSTRWDKFEPRDGDIVVATFAKVGTTWTQRIVDLLVHQSPDVRPVLDIAPWLDSTIFNPIEDDLATLQVALARTRESGEPFELELRLTTPAGEARRVMARGVGHRLASGAPAEVVGVMCDVTEQRRLEAIQRDGAERLAQIIERLPAGAVHVVGKAV